MRLEKPFALLDAIDSVPELFESRSGSAAVIPAYDEIQIGLMTESKVGTKLGDIGESLVRAESDFGFFECTTNLMEVLQHLAVA